MAKKKVEVEDEKMVDDKTEDLKEELKEKKEKWEWLNIWTLKWEVYDETMSEDEQEEVRIATVRELKESENALATIISELPDVKKAYIDNEKRDDPFYVDYNLLFNNVDMLMALWYSNEMKAVFTGTNSADLDNSDVISKTAEYDYREEMDMDLIEYEVQMDKLLSWMWAVIRDGWNEETNSPIPKCWPAEYCRPDPMWRWNINRYRYIWWYGKMTMHQMKQAGNFFNLEQVIDTEWLEKESSDRNNNWSNITITPNGTEDEAAYFAVFNQFRTKEDGTKCLVTLANCGKLLVRYIELDYEIGGKPVFPISLDFWKPKRWFPFGIKLHDLSWRKQKVLSLLLNLWVKKAVRSSLGNHLIVDEDAIKNKNQLRQLTEFPELILVDTNNGAKSVNNIVSELQRSQVPQDNYNTEERIKQLNYEETSIWPNQLGISPSWNQTATEIKDNATNSNVRLSLANRISMNYYKDFWRKRLMMYQYHFKDGSKKQVTISREFGDRYLTFEKKYLKFSNDPHIKIISKFDQEQKNKQLFANHVVLHSYIEKLAAQSYVPLEVRLSMRKALRLMGYNEDEIIDFVRESAEEQEAKEQLYLLNNDEMLEPLDPDQIDENHQDYLQVYRQAKETKATKAAVRDRVNMMKQRDLKRREEEKQAAIQASLKAQGWANTNWMANQMTANMINQSNSANQPSLADAQM